MADWTTVEPEIVSDPAPNLIFEESGGRTATIRVRVRFTDDSTPTPNTREKDYVVSGANARADLARLVHTDQQTLQGYEATTVGSITPIAPTPTEQAIADYRTAVHRRRSLQTLQDLMGLADGDTLGTSGLTVTQVKSSLASDIVADMTSQARITVALDAL